MKKTLPAFHVNFAKPFLLKTGYSLPSKIVTFWTFHISVFVNTTAMVVNSDTILYMCIEVIICQSDRSPERLMISHTPGIGGNLKSAQVGEGMWRKLSHLLGCILQNPSFSKWDIPNFQNCGILDLPHLHFCICQYY